MRTDRALLVFTTIILVAMLAWLLIVQPMVAIYVAAILLRARPRALMCAPALPSDHRFHVPDGQCVDQAQGAGVMLAG